MIRTHFPRSGAAVLFIIGSLLLSACEDDPPPEDRVASVVVASGSGQSGRVGEALGSPLVARALDENGNPVRGAAMSWSAAAGSIMASEARTDEFGQTEATWTLGTTTGQQQATASVGLNTVSFTATALPGAAASLTVTPASVLLDAIGATATLSAAARDAYNNTIPTPTPAWTSLNPAVATVNASGVVTAVSAGSGTIRATLDNASTDIAVVVAPAVASITVTPANPVLTVIGGTVQLSATARDRNGNPVSTGAQPVLWSSVSPAVVSVSSTGLVTAVGAGTTTVRAQLGTVIGQTQVTVQQTVGMLTVAPKTDTLRTGASTRQMTVTALDTNGAPIANPTVTWSSTNPAVAAVGGTGLVNGLTNGTTKIVARSGAVTDSATIVVRLNTAPKPGPDTLATVLDTPINLAAPGLLANDTIGIPKAAIVSFGADSLGGTSASNAAGATVAFGTGGSLTVNADGSMSFTPSTGSMAPFVFRYRAQNAAGIGETQVRITIGSAPAAVDDAYATAPGVVLNVPLPGVLGNDGLGSPAAKVVSYGGGNFGGTVTSFAAGTANATANGSLFIGANGNLLYNPLGFTGVLTVQYRISNGAATSDATITITVS